MFGADHHNSKESTLVATSDSNNLLTALDNTLYRVAYTFTYIRKLPRKQILRLRCSALPAPLYSLRNTPFTLQWVFARRA